MSFHLLRDYYDRNSISLTVQVRGETGVVLDEGSVVQIFPAFLQHDYGVQILHRFWYLETDEAWARQYFVRRSLLGAIIWHLWKGFSLYERTQYFLMRFAYYRLSETQRHQCDGQRKTWGLLCEVSGLKALLRGEQP